MFLLPLGKYNLQNLLRSGLRLAPQLISCCFPLSPALYPCHTVPSTHSQTHLVQALCHPIWSFPKYTSWNIPFPGIHLMHVSTYWILARIFYKIQLKGCLPTEALPAPLAHPTMWSPLSLHVMSYMDLRASVPWSLNSVSTHRNFD